LRESDGAAVIDHEADLGVVVTDDRGVVAIEEA
jgi:hypothetical protein